MCCTILKDCNIHSVADVHLVLLFWFRLIPESPRWLLLHGKEKEAKTWFKKVAKVNGEPYPQFEFEKTNDAGVHGGFKDLFYDREIRKRTFLSWDMWQVYTICSNVG